MDFRLFVRIYGHCEVRSTVAIPTEESETLGDCRVAYGSSQ